MEKLWNGILVIPGYFSYIREGGMIEKISFYQGSNDEQANIDLAVQLSETEDTEGIKEITAGLADKKAVVANDCIKVLYEIAERKPALIAGYVKVFLDLLGSKNNRLIWGAMTALSRIAHLKPQEIMDNIDQVQNAYKNGSVITIDNGISVFAELVKADLQGSSEIYDLLIAHLTACRPKEVPQHAERIFICIKEDNAIRYKEILEQRVKSLSDSQKKRVQKLLDRIKKHQFAI
jgi:hypothetical protein